MRTTHDLEVLTPDTRSSGARVAAMLSELGATRQDGSALADRLFDGEHQVRALTPFGLLDVMPEGASPLTYREVADAAHRVLIDGTEAPVCDLAHLVAFKRLADRPRGRADLADLEVARGPLPDLLADKPVDRRAAGRGSRVAAATAAAAVGGRTRVQPVRANMGRPASPHRARPRTRAQPALPARTRITPHV